MRSKLGSLPYIETVFSNTKEKERWQNIDGKKIFITGGTGFFGKWWLACYLYAKKHLGVKAEITILSRSPGFFISEFPECNIADISWCVGDITTFVPPEINFDFIIHMARNDAKASLKDPISQFYSIVFGTKQVLEMAIRNSDCTLLFISSGAVYGNYSCARSEDLLSKTDLLNSDNGYLIAKQAAEQLCSLYHKQYGLNVKIARCFTFLGPFLQLNTHFAAGNFIHSVIHNHDIIIKSDGKAIRSYMYPTDLIDWLMAIMIQGKPIVPYNVGSSCQVSIQDLAQTIIDVSNNPVEYKVMGKISANDHRHVYVPDTSKTEYSLGVKLKIDLKQMILSTIRWYYSSVD